MKSPAGIWISVLLFGFGSGFAAGDPDTLLQRLRQGDWRKVEEDLAAKSDRTPFEARLLVELYDRRGDVEMARVEASRLIRNFGLGDFEATSHYHAAFAAAYLQRWEEANDLFLKASQLESVPLSLYVDWGRLYLEKYNPAEAETIFREGLDLEPIPGVERWGVADLYLGLARAAKDMGSPAYAEALEEAGAVDSESPELKAFRARMVLQDEKWDEAAEIAAEGLKLTPDFLPLAEIATAVVFFRDTPAQYEKALEQLRRVNPRNAGFHELLAEICVGMRRMDEAIDQYSEALRLDPRRWSALAARGINLLRMDREEEGIADLERAYQNDPYNIWTVNTLRLVDSFSNFRRFETRRFQVKVHEKEAAVLQPYLEELLERSLTTLERRYDHEVPHRVVFEMYPDHEDFAVRTLGLPGLGALGAAFGRVVAMDSPSARPSGQFHWASTLWHELAHIVTLSLSHGRVPRWFTEGISMMEERLAGSGWGDHLSIHFVEAWRAGKLLHIRDLNSGFLRPETPQQIAISYYQAGRICDYLTERYGLPSLRSLLVAYGEGLDTDEAFKKVFDKDVDTIDKEFQEYLAADLDPIARRLVRPKSLEGDTAELEAALAADPENFYLNFAVASRYHDAKRYDEAIPLLRQAIAGFPWALEETGPYGLLVEILGRQEREAEAVEVLKQWWAKSPMLSRNGLRLARHLHAHGQAEDAARALEQALYSDPLSPDLHRKLGELYLELERPRLAVREFQVLLALDPVDRAEAHFLLAQALHRNGDRTEARRQVLLALEIAPSFDEAQRLLLQVIRP